MLIDVITDTWQPAEQIAKQSMLPFHSATKMLYSMAAEGSIESKEYEWTDERCRQRKRTLYRKKPEIESLYFLDSIFGIPHPATPCCAINARRHVLR